MKQWESLQMLRQNRLCNPRQSERDSSQSWQKNSQKQQQSTGTVLATTFIMTVSNKIAKFSSAMLVSTLLLTGCEKQPSEALGESELNNAVISPVAVDPDKLNAPSQLNEDTGTATVPLSCRNGLIVDAFNKQISAVQIKGCGTVKAVLPDDNKGSRHQRFIVQLEGVQPSHTVLIAHNIDLAPRIDALEKGDNVVFYGQYEYNSQGGVVHWTHHDPAARHQDGWIEHAGKRFM